MRTAPTPTGAVVGSLVALAIIKLAIAGVAIWLLLEIAGPRWGDAAKVMFVQFVVTLGIAQIEKALNKS